MKSQMSTDPIASEILQLNQRLLESIAAGDWATYESLCAPDLTCFEPEAAGHLVEGMAFHKFYFDLGASSGPRNVTMATPHVRLLGDATAIVAYSRLVQRLDNGRCAGHFARGGNARLAAKCGRLAVGPCASIGAELVEASWLLSRRDR